MEQTHSCPLLLERAARYLSDTWKESRLPFLASLVFGMLAYAFAFTNKLVNHDEVHELFSKGATVDSGRWGLGFLDSIFPNLSMPWIYGILSILFIAAAICLILRVFQIRRKVLQVLLAGCIMVFPSLIGTFGYMFTSCSFALSFLLAVISVYLLQRKNKLCWLFALGCMVFSLSIYQAYISVAAGLLVALLVGELMRGEKVSGVISNGLWYVLFLILSLGCYYAATQVFLKLLHVKMNGYASGNLSFSLSAIPANILAAYQGFSLYFSRGARGLMPTSLSRWAHILCLASAAVLLLLWSRGQKKRELSRYLLLGALLLIMPLAVNCMYLFTTPESIHTLVLYGFVSIYVLVIAIADIILSAWGKDGWLAFFQSLLLDILTLCMSLTILINIFVANAAYLNLHLRYENAYNFYSSLSAQIKQMPEFTPDTKLAVLGTYQEPEFYREHFPFLEELTGVKGFLPDSYSRGKFLEYYLAFPMPAPTDAEVEEILASPEYAEMAVYPYYGSMRFFGNTIVVKLSD